MTFPNLIREDEVYTIDEFSKRLKLGKVSWRTMRRNGLPVHRVGQRIYVIGREFSQWLATQPGETLKKK